MLDWSSYPNFSESKFACQCGCAVCGMDPEFMHILQATRTACDEPFFVTSGFRCREHHLTRQRPGSKHALGKAVDVRVLKDREGAVIVFRSMAASMGLDVGVGRYPNDRLHLDIRPQGTGAEWVGS